MTPPTSNPSSAMSQGLSESHIGIVTGIVWRCDVTGNPVGTDTEMIGTPPCLCQGHRAALQAAKLFDMGEALQSLATTCRTIADERDSLQRKNEELARALTAILGCEYDGKGLTDCIDNDGGHYQSAHLERCIREAEQALRSISEEK